MKKLKSLFTTFFALACVCAMSTAAFAQTLTPAVDPPLLVSDGSESAGTLPEPSSDVGSEESAMEPIPEVIELDPDEYASLSEKPASQLESQQDSEAPSEPEEDAKGNTMYFVGAGAAVILLAGVIIFCKVKSKQ